MSQTLLAILAILLATMFSFQQHRQAVQLQLNMIRNEVATQAMGVAVDRLEEIGSKAFDEKTVGEKLVLVSDSLTAGPPYLRDAQGNDIDDFHGVAVDTFRVASSGEILRFRVETTVTYASSSNPEQPAPGPTKFKKATVKAYSLNIPYPDTIRLSQSYACGSRCAW